MDATATPSAGRPFTILSIPSGHPYVERVTPSGATRLPDPTSPWWPHPGLTTEHLSGIAGLIDAVHVHFGFEHRSPDELLAWVQALEDLGLPLVYTVHDLENPNLLDQDRHTSQLDVLIPAAAEVITLTHGAAAEIATRWHRRATVVPHPPLAWSSGRPLGSERIIGIDVHHPRPNLLDAGDVTAVVGRAAAKVRARVRIRVGERTKWLVDQAIADGRLGGTVDVWDGPRHLTEEAFNRYVADHAAMILPYRHGTHSGRIELCLDLGVVPIFTRCGHMEEQAGRPGLQPGMLTGCGDELADHLARALGERPLPCSRRDYRRRVAAIQAAHRSIYCRVDRSGRLGGTAPLW